MVVRVLSLRWVGWVMGIRLVVGVRCWVGAMMGVMTVRFWFLPMPVARLDPLREKGGRADHVKLPNASIEFKSAQVGSAVLLVVLGVATLVGAGDGRR
jgi:hypothetical protein